MISSASSGNWFYAKCILLIYNAFDDFSNRQRGLLRT